MNILGLMKDMTNIGAVDHYRLHSPLEEVNRQDNGIVCHYEDKATVVRMGVKADDLLDDHDVLFLARSWYGPAGLGAPFIEMVHSRNCLVVIDSDDDLTETYKLTSGRGDDFKAVLGMVDYVTCSTPPLAELFAQWSQKPPTVLRNCVEGDWMRKAGRNGKPPHLQGRLTIGFSGSPTHWGDWYLPAVPFARIGKDFPEVLLTLHGNTPSYLKYAGEQADLLLVPKCPLSMYPSALRHFDIVLCAVDSRDEFNAGKSAVKALECMALGVVPICSRFEPYMDLEKAGAPLVVVPEDSRDAWYEAMRAMVQPGGYREALSAAGPQWVRENRDMTISGYKQWESFFRGIID